MYDEARLPDSDLLAAYRQLLIEHVRYLPLAGRDEGEQRLPIADLFIERTLFPVDFEPSARIRSDESEVRTLGELARAPGARILLTGEPGGGKTTSLRRLALDCAASMEADAADDTEDWPGAASLPLLLHSRTSAPGEAQERSTLPLGNELTPSLPAFWPATLKFSPRGGSGHFPALTQALRIGVCLVLIDGDALTDTADVALFRLAVESFVVRYPDNCYIVTCRSHLVPALLPLAGFAAYTLTPLNDREVDAMIACWCPAIMDARLTPEALAEHVAILQGKLRGDERLRSLVGNPLALALWIRACAAAWPRPVSRALLLRQILEHMLAHEPDDLDARSPVSSQAIATVDQQLTLLQTLALPSQSLPRSQTDQRVAIQHAETTALLGAALGEIGFKRRGAVKQIIPALLESWLRRGLLVRAGPSSAYALPWPALREYLAARALAAQPGFSARAHVLRRDPRWHEALLLAVHELVQDGAPVAALALPRLLLDSASDADPHDLLLAAECLLEISQRAEPEQALCGEAGDRLLALLGARVCPLAARIQAGLLLGHLGDPRFTQLRPPVTHVAAGAYLFGSREGYEDEGPARRVDVPAFAIGVYPVTNREYARFLASVYGHPRPHYWHDTRFNNPSQPVVGVTWEDANAYCAWLTASLEQAGLLPRDLVVRLPLDVEWEKAAAWDPQRRVKRRYPWGDEWSSARANIAEGRGAWMTAPVGCYPDGVSAYGVHDMIGNVWEWTANEYASYPGAAAPFHEVGSYTLRGSSCVSRPTHARCTFRSRLPASYWRYHLGFRIVLARPLNMLTEEQRGQR
jgi:iron(II)-dependent oxidoreductase